VLWRRNGRKTLLVYESSRVEAGSHDFYKSW